MTIHPFKCSSQFENALDHYATSSYSINNCLRANSQLCFADRATVSKLDQYLKHKRYDGVVYAGVWSNNFEFPAYVSGSKSFYIAAHYAHRYAKKQGLSKGVVISAYAGTVPSACIEKHSRSKDEQEVLIARNVKFFPTEVETVEYLDLEISLYKGVMYGS